MTEYYNERSDFDHIPTSLVSKFGKIVCTAKFDLILFPVPHKPLKQRLNIDLLFQKKYSFIQDQGGKQDLSKSFNKSESKVKLVISLYFRFWQLLNLSTIEES